MAHIREKRDKDGNLTALYVRVYRGRDSDGRQLAPLNHIVKVEKGWSEARAHKEAEKQAVIKEKEYRDGLISDNRQNFSSYAQYALSLKERIGIKHSTITRYNDLLKRIDEGIGHIKLKDLRPQHLNQFYDELGREGMNKKTGGKLSSKTILEYHRLISTILAQAEREGVIVNNPAQRASPPKVQKPAVNHFQIADIKRIVEALESEPIKWQAITYLLMATGCRRGEVMGLRWDSVDFNTNTIRIENNLQYSADKGIYAETTKTGKNRTVKVGADTMDILRQYKKWQKEERLKNGDRWVQTGYVFTLTTAAKSSDPQKEYRWPGEAMHPDSITDWLEKFAKRHDLPHINPHAFRHTYASSLIMKGLDIVTVSKQLGHEKVSTTADIYAELMEEASEAAADIMGDVIFGKAK